MKTLIKCSIDGEAPIVFTSDNKWTLKTVIIIKLLLTIVSLISVVLAAASKPQGQLLHLFVIILYINPSC